MGGGREVFWALDWKSQVDKSREREWPGRMKKWKFHPHPTLCWISRVISDVAGGPRAWSNSCLYRLCFLDSVTQEELLEDKNFLNDSGAGSKMHWDHSILKLRQNFSSLCGEQVRGRWEDWARKNTKSSKVHPNTFFCIRKVCKDHSTVHGSHDYMKSLAGQNQMWAMKSTWPMLMGWGGVCVCSGKRLISGAQVNLERM